MLHLVIIIIVCCTLSAPSEGIAIIGPKSYIPDCFCRSDERVPKAAEVTSIYNAAREEFSDCVKHKFTHRPSFLYTFIINQYQNKRNNYCSIMDNIIKRKTKKSGLSDEFAYRKRNLLWTYESIKSLKTLKPVGNLLPTSASKSSKTDRFSCLILDVRDKKKLFTLKRTKPLKPKRVKRRAPKRGLVGKARHFRVSDTEPENELPKFLRKGDSEEKSRPRFHKNFGLEKNRELSHNNVPYFKRHPPGHITNKYVKNSDSARVKSLIEKRLQNSYSDDVIGFRHPRLNHRFVHKRNREKGRRCWLRRRKPLPLMNTPNIESSLNEFENIEAPVRFSNLKKQKMYSNYNSKIGVSESNPYTQEPILDKPINVNKYNTKQQMENRKRQMGLRRESMKFSPSESVLRKPYLANTRVEKEIPVIDYDFSDYDEIHKMEPELSERHQTTQNFKSDHKNDFSHNDPLKQLKLRMELRSSRRFPPDPKRFIEKMDREKKCCCSKNSKTRVGSRRCWKSAPLLCVPYIKKGQDDLLKYLIKVMQKMIGKTDIKRHQIFENTKFKPSIKKHVQPEVVTPGGGDDEYDEYDDDYGGTSTTCEPKAFTNIPPPIESYRRPMTEKPSPRTTECKSTHEPTCPPLNQINKETTARSTINKFFSTLPTFTLPEHMPAKKLDLESLPSKPTKPPLLIFTNKEVPCIPCAKSTTESQINFEFATFSPLKKFCPDFDKMSKQTQPCSFDTDHFQCNDEKSKKFASATQESLLDLNFSEATEPSTVAGPSNEPFLFDLPNFEMNDKNTNCSSFDITNGSKPSFEPFPKTDMNDDFLKNMARISPKKAKELFSHPNFKVQRRKNKLRFHKSPVKLWSPDEYDFDEHSPTILPERDDASQIDKRIYWTRRNGKLAKHSNRKSRRFKREGDYSFDDFVNYEEYLYDLNHGDKDYEKDEKVELDLKENEERTTPTDEYGWTPLEFEMFSDLAKIVTAYQKDESTSPTDSREDILEYKGTTELRSSTEKLPKSSRKESSTSSGKNLTTSVTHTTTSGTGTTTSGTGTTTSGTGTTTSGTGTTTTGTGTTTTGTGTTTTGTGTTTTGTGTTTTGTGTTTTGTGTTTSGTGTTTTETGTTTSGTGTTTTKTDTTTTGTSTTTSGTATTTSGTGTTNSGTSTTTTKTETTTTGTSTTTSGTGTTTTGKNYTALPVAIIVSGTGTTLSGAITTTSGKSTTDSGTVTTTSRADTTISGGTTVGTATTASVANTTNFGTICTCISVVNTTTSMTKAPTTPTVAVSTTTTKTKTTKATTTGQLICKMVLPKGRTIVGSSSTEKSPKVEAAKEEKPLDGSKDLDETEENQSATTLGIAYIVKGVKKQVTKPSPKIYTKVFPDSVVYENRKNDAATTLETPAPTSAGKRNVLHKATPMAALLISDVRLQLLAVCEGYLEVLKLMRSQNRSLAEELDSDLSKYCESIISQSFSGKTDPPKPKKVETSSYSKDDKEEVQNTSNKEHNTVEEYKPYSPGFEVFDKEFGRKLLLEGEKCNETGDERSKVRKKKRKKGRKRKKENKSETVEEDDEELLKKGMTKEQVELLKLFKKRKTALLNWLLSSNEVKLQPESEEIQDFDTDSEIGPDTYNFKPDSGTARPKGAKNYRKTTKGPEYTNYSLYPIYAKQYGYDKEGELRQVEVLWRTVNNQTHERKILKNQSVLSFFLVSTPSPKDVINNKFVDLKAYFNDDNSDSQRNTGDQATEITDISTTPVAKETTKVGKTTIDSRNTVVYISKPDPSSIIGNVSTNKTDGAKTQKNNRKGLKIGKLNTAKEVVEEYTIEFWNYAVYILPIMFSIMFLFCCACCAMHFWRKRKRKGKKRKKNVSSTEETLSTDETDSGPKKKKRREKTKKLKSVWNALKKKNRDKCDSENNDESNPPEKKRNFLRFLKGKKNEKVGETSSVPYSALPESDEPATQSDTQSELKKEDNLSEVCKAEYVQNVYKNESETRKGKEMETRKGKENEARKGKEQETRKGKEQETRKVKENEIRKGSKEYEIRKGSKEYEIRKGSKENEGHKSKQFEVHHKTKVCGVPNETNDNEASERRELISLLEELKEIELEQVGEKKEQKSVHVQYMIQNEDDSQFRRMKVSDQVNVFGFPKGCSFYSKAFPFHDHEKYDIYKDVEEMEQLLPCECSYYGKKHNYFRDCDFPAKEDDRCEEFLKIFRGAGTRRHKLSKVRKFTDKDRNFILDKYRSAGTRDEREPATEVGFREKVRDITPFSPRERNPNDWVGNMEDYNDQLTKKKPVRLKDDGVLCRL